MTSPRTPYYLVDESRLRANLEVVQALRERSGAKFVLALKCFAAWSVFDLMAQYLDGTTSSSVNEARLGHEHFGGEVHAYSVAFSRDEVAEVADVADKVIFNSASQLQAHHDLVAHLTVGVRVNPGVSHSRFDLADPARRYSRLGIVDLTELDEVAPLVSGIMFHFNCENDDVADLLAALDRISARYGSVLERMSWVSLGGGISFTVPGYPVERLADALAAFADRHGVQVYLEPGEAAVVGSAELVTTVLDVVHNEVDVAIVDASLEAHLPESLVYDVPPEVSSPSPGAHRVTIAGRTCLAGDVFGDFDLAAPLRVGDEVRFDDAAAYTMVKATWFNGVPRPSIVVRRLDGTVEVVREFGYDDYRRSLS
jgi:carboxynorspermidine decarboxylase